MVNAVHRVGFCQNVSKGQRKNSLEQGMAVTRRGLGLFTEKVAARTFFKIEKGQVPFLDKKRKITIENSKKQ